MPKRKGPRGADRDRGGDRDHDRDRDRDHDRDQRKCYMCGSSGHVKINCFHNKGKVEKSCFVCGKKDHMAHKRPDKK